MNKETIKKGFILVLLIGFFLSGSLIGSAITHDIREEEAEGFNQKTLLLGTVINPSLEENVWTAQAFHVFYYQSGLLFHQGGVVKPMTQINFSDDMFIMVWTPGPFELFGYVFGVTSDFSIVEE